MKSFYEFCGSSTWIGDFSLRKTTTQTQTTEYMKNEKLWNQNVIWNCVMLWLAFLMELLSQVSSTKFPCLWKWIVESIEKSFNFILRWIQWLKSIESELEWSP